MLFETKQKKKFRKKTDKQGNVILDSLWQSVDMDEMILPQTDHLSITLPAFKKQANLFVRRLFRAGAFQKFSKAQQVDASHGWAPKGYEVALKMPLHCGGNYHLSNFVLMPQGYRSILYDLYLRQVADEIEKLPSKKKLFLMLPHLPDFITPETFLTILFPEDRKQVLDFFKKQKMIHQNRTQKVEKMTQGKKVLFKLKRCPVFSFPCVYREYRVLFPTLMERERVWKEYNKSKENLLIQAIQRGDFGALDKKAQERLLKTHQLSSDLKLTCHHILPRQLGGKNSIENVVWMREEEHKKLHLEALTPLVEAVLDEVQQPEGKEYIILLPVPQSSFKKENAKVGQVLPKKDLKLFKKERWNKRTKS